MTRKSEKAEESMMQEEAQEILKQQLYFAL
jgi:hypothetical protein